MAQEGVGLDGKVALVTGAGRGIGRAIAQRFARDGWRIAAAARTASELDETQQLIESAGGACLAVPTDLTDATAIGTLVEKTEQKFGGVHLLVNCAGTVTMTGIEELEQVAFDRMHAVNERAVFTLCRAVWPVMRRAGGGVIVNLSSLASVDPFPGLAVYGATKAWVNAFTHGLAVEGREAGIQVFSVAPGAVETQMLREVAPDLPAEHCLAPEDVAEVVYTLAQPGCRYATGQTVFMRK